MTPISRSFGLGLLLAALAAPLAAADKAPAAPAAASPSLAELGQSLKNALTEEETRLLLEYMRDSVLATFKDEEVTLPPDLAFKLEVLAQRMKKVGGFYLDNLVKQLEEDIKRSLKEKMEPGPPVPYTPPTIQLLAPPAAAPAPAPTTPPAGAMPQAPVYVPVPWFYVPSPNYSVPAYSPPPLPWFSPPAPAPANKQN